MKKKLLLIACFFVVVMFTACETHNNVGQTRSGVFLTIDSIIWNTSAGQLAYVDDDGALHAESDTAEIVFSNRPKNAELVSSPWLVIQIEEYQVSFYRIDGGTAVPNTIRRKIRYSIDFNTTLTIAAITLLSAEQKAESPLWELAVNGYDAETNLATIEVNVLIEVFGKLVSGESVYAQGWTSIAYGVTTDD